MSFIKGCFIGLIAGIYFGEKNLPFPLLYKSQDNGDVGSIVIDLRVANTIKNDIRSLFGYGSVEASAP
jgi:glutamine amidotransferase-like uncharacterized protein